MSDAPEITITAGKPTDALQRQRLASWSFGSLVPRQNLTNYRTREGKTVLETLHLVRDRDPDAALAVSNFLLLVGQGYETAARNGEEVDEQASAYLRELDARVGSEYGGGMDALVDVLVLTLVTQGAMALEIEVADDLTEVADYHPIDPARITAKREKDTQRLMWGMQLQRGTPGTDQDGFLEFSPRQFRYMPLHPDVDDPYGRSPILAALTAVFFKVQVLEDLRAVVHNQGYPRIKASILEEVIANNLPANATPQQRQALVKDLQKDLQSSFAALNPDDALIFPSSVDVGYLGIPSGTLVDVKALADLLDKQIVSGLKHLPILLGRNEGATTTHATVQWKIFVLLIESLRRKVKRLLEWGHTTALQVAGYQSRAHVSFEDLQTNDRLVDAQALETESRAWSMLVDRGWATDDEAAQAILRHDAEGTPVPAPEPARRPRQTRRLPSTRVAPHETERTALEEALHEQVADLFIRLLDDYPFDAVAEQVAGLTTLDVAAIEESVAAWFAARAGRQWADGMTTLIVEHYVSAYTVGGQLALDDLGITVGFKLKNPDVLQALRDLGAERVTGITDVTRQQMVNQLVAGFEAGEGIPEYGRRLRGLVEGMTRRRSELIAVTETASALGKSSLETYARNGLKLKGWLTTGDARVTPGCQENADASPIAIDEAFPSGHMHPPRFPSCRCALIPILDDYEAPEAPWTGE